MALTEKQTQEKIEQYAPLIQKYDSPISEATRIAQLILESQLFTSDLALKSNNGFGIKVSKPWTGEGASHLSGEVGGARVSEFRKYPTHEASIKDHAGFFTSTDFRATNAVYGLAIKADNYKDEAMNLGPKFPGDENSYAGDPKYGPKLIEIIERYNLTQYDTKKESVQMTFPKPAMTDRRKHALGYPSHGAYARRSKSAIKNIVWHYTAVKRSLNRKIWDHEQYWKNTHKWDIGGYHYYIDSDGKIYWNYDLEIATYGASAANPYTMHISVEANSASDYSQAQIKAREDLTLWLLTNDLKHLTGQSMRGHKEVPGNSTSCPGYSVAQLNQFRADLDAKLKRTSKPTPPQVVKPTSDNQYTVKHGDTLWLVATAHGLTLNQIRELNPTRKNDMLYTGDKLRVKGDVPKIDTPTEGKEQGLKNPKEYPVKGTFEFNTSVNVRNSPRLDNKPVALYSKGERVNYDRILYGASYTWLSYISYDGTRRYVACGDNGQLYGKFI